MSETVILVRYAEIHLKGLNRPFFEKRLEDNMKKALGAVPHRIERESGRIYVTGIGDTEYAVNRLKKVFGIHPLSLAAPAEKHWDTTGQPPKTRRTNQ